MPRDGLSELEHKSHPRLRKPVGLELGSEERTPGRVVGG